MDDSTTTTISALAGIEPRLRQLLPADLYAAAWLDPTSGTLLKVFEHLRTLQWALYSYVPRHVAEVVPQPGELRFQWQRGTLMFADLVGFTPLMEANATLGPAGATSLLSVLNRCFSSMIETITRSGGNLLAFTGRDVVEGGPTLTAGGTDHRLRSSIGIATGSVFAAEFGEPRGRREFNILGDAVNTAARLMSRAERGEILVTDAVRTELAGRFEVTDLGAVALKGKRARHDLYRVIGRNR